MSKIKKKSDTSVRVLETLKILSNQPLSIQEIIHYFEKINPKYRIYTSEAILKYINTLKVFGFKFEKDKDKYVLVNGYPRIDLNLQELTALKLLEQASLTFPEENIKNKTLSLIHEIEHKFSDKTVALKREIKKPNIQLSNKFEKEKKQIKKLEKLCIDG